MTFTKMDMNSPIPSPGRTTILKLIGKYKSAKGGHQLGMYRSAIGVALESPYLLADILYLCFKGICCSWAVLGFEFESESRVLRRVVR